jgi:hypothetical protein
MEEIRWLRRVALIAAAAMALASCARQKDPAQKLLTEIDSTITAASGEASKYVPDRLMEVQTEFGGLEASFDKRDYAAVVAGAPAVLDAAQKLATAAAVKKDEILKARSVEWAALAGSVPGDVIAIQSRIEALGKTSSSKLKPGIDLPAAKAGLSDAASLWSKAQAAFAAGNMEEAVATAKTVRAKIDDLAAALKLQLAPLAAAVWLFVGQDTRACPTNDAPAASLGRTGC